MFLLPEELPDEIRDTIEASGLISLVESSYRKVDRRLIGAFVDRWYEETSSFHLPCGEMTITLDDVSSLLHIPVTGTLIPWDKPNQADAVLLMTTYLGMTVEDAIQETSDIKSGAIRFNTLEELFIAQKRQRNWDNCARIYLLYLVGSTLFADKTNNSVGCHLLNAFFNLAPLRIYTTT